MNPSSTLDASTPVSPAGLSLSDILGDLPSDPGSIVALILLLGFLTVVLYFGTRSGKPTQHPDPEPTDPPMDAGRKETRLS